MGKNIVINEKEIWKPGNMLYPLPVVMVSAGREGEKPNLITLAWTGTICSDPAMLYISVRPERYSHGILMDTEEFVVNLTTKELVRATDFCGVKSGRDIDKFKECGLTAGRATAVSAPILVESPVNIECKVKDVKKLGSHDMFIAEVVAVQASKKYADENGKFDLTKADPICYSHGEYYAMGEKLGSFGYSVRKKK